VDSRHQYDRLADVYLVIGVAVFALVALILFWFLFRYRVRRAGPPGAVHEHTVVESVYAVALVAITAFLLFKSFHTETRIDRLSTSAAPAVRVAVTAAQWNWKLTYPGGLQIVTSADTPREFVLPAGRRILFSGRSQDVLHDFWIPDLRFQRQVWPDHTETWGLVFPKPGRYQGVCAWFCGLNHDRMDFVVRAVSAASYTAWLRRARA
jgi:cytochrome c oxidase subunit II